MDLTLNTVQAYFEFLLLQGEGELAKRKGGSMVEVRKGMIRAFTLTSVWVWAATHLGLQNTEVLSHVKIVLF